MNRIIFILIFLFSQFAFCQLEQTQTSYQYDNLNRLIQVIYNDGTEVNYTYDDLGNRTQLTVVDEEVELTFIPDDAFEGHLIELGIDDVMDDFVVTANISGITAIDLGGLGMADATGLQDFTALEDLIIRFNSLTELDMTQNTALRDINASNNDLSSINLSNLSTLEVLVLDQNEFVDIDITTNQNIYSLSLSNNNIGEIDLSNTSLLEVFRFDNNPITQLDLSDKTSLRQLEIEDGNLNSLNLKNNNNDNILVLSTLNNPNLTCIQVDDAVAANESSGVYADWELDDIVTFSEDCGLELTFVPDDAFEQRLIDLNLDNVLDDYVVTSNISSLTILNLDGTGVVDLTGIEDFAALTTLDAGFSNIQTVDLSTNTQLTELNLRDNNIDQITLGGTQFTFINLDENELDNFDPSIYPNLNHFSMRNNNLSEINLSGLTNLDLVILRFNNLSAIDVSDSNLLTHLDVQGNMIEEIDLTNQNILDFLLVNDNELTLLNLKSGGNNELETVQAENNPNLLCIQVDNEVDATNGDGVYGGWSKDDVASYSQDCEALLNIEENLLTGISIYPNPTDSILNLSLTEQYYAKELNVTIVNLLGQVVFSVTRTGADNITIPVENLGNGSYFVSVTTEEGSWSEQFIKE